MDEACVDWFTVANDLVGLAIGSRGCNIKRAQRIKGIISIEKYGAGEGFRFTVVGETREAVQKARALLEYTRHTFTVPFQFAEQFTGENCEDLQEIKEKSKICSIKLPDDYHKGYRNDLILVITGRLENIDNAKILLSFKLSHYKEVHEKEKQIELARPSLFNKPSRGFGRGQIKGTKPIHCDWSNEVTNENSRRKRNRGRRGRGRGNTRGRRRSSSKERGSTTSLNSINFSDCEEIQRDHEPMEVDGDNFTQKQSHYVTQSVISEGIKYSFGKQIRQLDEMQVLKFLVQEFSDGGCTLIKFIQRSEFKGLFDDVDIEDWLNAHSEIFHIYRNPHIVYIAPFYKEIDICKHFFNPSQPTVCNYTRCKFFHVCRKFVRGNCKETLCSLPHDFSSEHNVMLKQKYRLTDLSDRHISVLLNWKLPRLCHDYIYEQTKCRRLVCPHLHYCRNQYFNECFDDDTCTYSHSFQDDHNSWVLNAFNREHQADHVLKRSIYVPVLNKHAQDSDWSDISGNSVESIDLAKERLGIPGNKKADKSSASQSWKSEAYEGVPEKGRPTFHTERIVSCAESEDCNSLSSDEAGNKSICWFLTKKDCWRPFCQDLHLKNKLPYLWQIEIKDEWKSFGMSSNFKIEHAFCSLEMKFKTEMPECSSGIEELEIDFDNMRGIYRTSSVSQHCKTHCKVRRLSTPSFVNANEKTDSYLTQWRWFWKDDGDAWLLYDSDEFIYTLETKFLKNQKSYLFSRENFRFKYRIDFTCMSQVNVDTGKCRTITRRPLYVSEYYLNQRIYPQNISSSFVEVFGDDLRPQHFSPWDLEHEFELVEIDLSQYEEYSNVTHSFETTMQKDKFKVVGLFRVQIRRLWSEYQIKKKHMCADAEKGALFTAKTIDERELYHGTDTLDTCYGICTNNFDFRTSGKNATVYGHGSYFAKEAIYSHNYTSTDYNGHRYMFRAKVLVGKFTQGQSDFRRPPTIPGESHKLFDSCVDNPRNPTIHIIFDRNQCYPEYIIKYTKNKTATPTVTRVPLSISAAHTSSSQSPPITTPGKAIVAGNVQTRRQKRFSSQTGASLSTLLPNIAPVSPIVNQSVVTNKSDSSTDINVSRFSTSTFSDINMPSRNQGLGSNTFTSTDGKPYTNTANSTTGSKPYTDTTNSTTGSKPNTNTANSTTGSKPYTDSTNYTTGSKANTNTANSTTGSKPYTDTTNYTTGSKPNTNSTNSTTGSKSNTNIVNSTTGSKPNTNTTKSTTVSKPNTNTANSTSGSNSNTNTTNSSAGSKSNTNTVNSSGINCMTSIVDTSCQDHHLSNTQGTSVTPDVRPSTPGYSGFAANRFHFTAVPSVSVQRTSSERVTSHILRQQQLSFFVSPSERMAYMDKVHQSCQQKIVKKKKKACVIM